MARLAPEDILNRRFATSGRRGYDREEVESFLAEVASAYRDALHSLARAESSPSYEQLGREAGAVLEAARRGAESLRQRAEEEAEGLREGGRRDADELRQQGQGEATEILEKATREAERTMREAELVARRLRNVTKRQCSEILAEAQSRHERLANHERELRRRIADIENVFNAFRQELDSEEVHTIRVDDAELEPEAGVEGEEAEAQQEAAAEEGRVRLRVEGVQPKPVFERGPGS